MEKHRERTMSGMLERGYTVEFASQLFEQIKVFGSYGFPESHSASFAGIFYASCWLKAHEPAAFACALLNSQPMGFYSASQIVQDAQRHRIRVYPVNVRYSDWDSTLESDPRRNDGAPLIRLGYRQMRGLSEAVARRIEGARAARIFDDTPDLCDRAGLDKQHQELLAGASAVRGLAGHRHRVRRATAGIEKQLPLFGNNNPDE